MYVQWTSMSDIVYIHWTSILSAADVHWTSIVCPFATGLDIHKTSIIGLIWTNYGCWMDKFWTFYRQIYIILYNRSAYTWVAQKWAYFFNTLNETRVSQRFPIWRVAGTRVSWCSCMLRSSLHEPAKSDHMIMLDQSAQNSCIAQLFLYDIYKRIRLCHT